MNAEQAKKYIDRIEDLTAERFATVKIVWGGHFSDGIIEMAFHVEISDYTGVTIRGEGEELDDALEDAIREYDGLEIFREAFGENTA